MSSTLALRASRSLARPAVFAATPRSFSTVEEAVTADDAWKKSCFAEMDYTIQDEMSVYDAVQRFAAYNIGCLVTTDNDGAFRARRVKCM